MSEKIVVAIDGPAGAGKSTIAKLIANRLGFTYLDTGAMYRAITYLAIRDRIVDDITSVINLTRGINIELKFENGITRVFANGEEVTDNIRTPEVNAKVSDISKIAEVRSELVEIQRKLAKIGNVVAEGRDTTTVVFPKADLKVYLTASVEERAKRRSKEYKENGVEISFDEVLSNISKRDEIDSGRDVSPLKKAEEAIEFDNSNISIDTELELFLNKIEKLLESKGFKKPS